MFKVLLSLPLRDGKINVKYFALFKNIFLIEILLSRDHQGDFLMFKDDASVYFPSIAKRGRCAKKF